MNKSLILLLCAAAMFTYMPEGTWAQQDPLKAGWVSLFDGKSLDGWKSNDEHPNVFTVTDGAIRINGGRAHLFYVGEVNGAVFKDFELKMKVKTTRGSSSGLYFHTEFQDRGWPNKGYECQINTSDSDKRKTGSLYGIQEVTSRSPSRDEIWFDYHIIVKGKSIIIKVNDREYVNYTEPKDVKRLASFRGRVLSEGTFALQGHHEGSEVFIKDIQVKPL